MKKILPLIQLSITSVVIAICSDLFAQTNPAPQTIPYSQFFTSGILPHSSAIFPAGWQGWSIPTGTATVFNTGAPLSDLPLQALSNASNTTEGIHNYNGCVGMLSAGATTTLTTNSSLCLAINTTGRFNVAIVYSMNTIRNPYNASTNNRICQAELQYRVGTAGSFTSLGGSSLYSNNTVNQTGATTTPQNQQTKSVALPAACSNQPIVQLRWVMRDQSGTVGNLRPSFGVDNVSICPSLTTPTISIAGPASYCSGAQATYTSSVTNGGSLPVYQWKKNGTNVGANSSTLDIGGLLVGDVISCVLTSSQNCVTSNTATSNDIEITNVSSSPGITSAIVTDVSCGTPNSGSIDITVSGGQPPYTFAWDTVNKDNGTIFGVIVGAKTASNPFPPPLGIGLSYYVNGVDGKELFLTKGIEYTFSLATIGHPWHVSTDSVGGNTLGFVSDGQSGPTTGSTSGTVTFKPNNSHPSTLYYPCGFHQWMGGRIRVVDGLNVEDLSGLSAGIYSVTVTDANGCSTSSQYTIFDSGTLPPTVSATVTPVDCGSNSGGAIDLLVEGGVEPYTICWDTSNTTNGGNFSVEVATKTAAHPAFGIGSAFGYVVDGVEGKELNLVEGITYSFNVSTTGHPFFITTSSTGGSTAGEITTGQTGAFTQNGLVTFQPSTAHPSLIYYQCSFHPNMGWNINTGPGFCTQNLSDVHAGVYTVLVTDDNGCTVTQKYLVGTSGSTVAINPTVTDAACINNGQINLDISGGTGVYTTCWDTTNKAAGPMFGVIAGIKTAAHPYDGLGSVEAFYIDGIEAKELHLTRGIDYTFDVMTPGHPWHISTDSVGSNANNLVISGQVGAPTDLGIVNFTPDITHPDVLRYVCAVHEYMGYKININNGFCVEDITGLGPGTYTAYVTDEIGCTATSSVVIGQNAYSISAALNGTTDASCFGLADGTADLEPADGIPPYSVLGTGPVFSVISQLKNHSHPYFGTGSGNGYTIDGVQGKELTLIRGITYSFSVLAPGHPFFISTSPVGGPANLASEVTEGVTGSMVTNGTLTFTPNASHPNLLYYQCGAHNNMGWRINIVDQLPDGDLGNCMAGFYSLVVFDANGCASSSTVDFNISEPGAEIFYYDGDNDTYGADSESALSCLAPIGFVILNGDCNDGDAAVNPGEVEICGNGIDDNCNGEIDEGCGITLNLRVLMQGYYVGGGQMQAVLLNQFVPGATGAESDTVKVELRSSADANLLVDQSTSPLDINGNGSFNFTTAIAGQSYWIVVKHRNSIQTWSAAPVVMNSSTAYDFTTSAAQAFAGNMVDQNLEGIWSMYTGDLNQDEFIDIFDFPDFDFDNQAFVAFAYVATDFNGDGFVDIFDFPVFDANNQSFIFSIHP